MMFWKSGKDHIGGALTGSFIWKTLAEIADREEELDLSQELSDNSQYESERLLSLMEIYKVKHW